MSSRPISSSVTYNVWSPTSLMICIHGEWCCGRETLPSLLPHILWASGKARMWNEKRLETHANEAAVPVGRKANLVIYKVHRTTFMR
jgi:hypothetical protein